MYMSTPQIRLEPQDFRKLLIKKNGVLVQTIQFEKSIQRLPNRQLPKKLYYLSSQD
jgi:hypothetical protein